MKNALEALGRHPYAISILEQLKRIPEGLRYTDLAVTVPGTKRTTVKDLVFCGLILHGQRGEPYKLSRKGGKALEFAGKLLKLGPCSSRNQDMTRKTTDVKPER